VGVSYAVHKVGLLGRILSCPCPQKVQPLGRIPALHSGRNSEGCGIVGRFLAAQIRAGAMS
jgi:hypothetical protein